jgi:hypothetical protein
MTFQITRHARISVPKSLRSTGYSKDISVINDEPRRVKKVLQKSLFMVPVVSIGSTTGVVVSAQSSLAFLGSENILGLFLLTMVVSLSSLFIVPAMIKHSIDNGSRKYFPGKPTAKYQLESIDKVEPFAEWDKVFLPYAVESFNGVSIKDAEGYSRKPIRLHTNHYVELRTASRTENIDYSMIEAQQI